MPRRTKKRVVKTQLTTLILKHEKVPTKENVTQTGYNEQIVVDNKNGLILAVDVTTDGNDKHQLIPMIKQNTRNTTKSIKPHR